MTFKKFLSVFVLTFFVKFGFGQVYQAMPQYGYGPVKRMDFDSTLTIPTFCGVPSLKSNILRKSAIAFDTCNNKFYTYNSKTLTWAEVSGGGGSTDTTSLSNRINLKLNIADTSTMLNKYLRKTDTASLSNRINGKADTSALNLKLNIADTANKWVNSVTKLNDSTIRVIKGASTTDITLTPSATITSATRLITTVYNKSGATIPKGSVVYIDGAHSSVLPSIALAQANQESTSAYTYGLVETDISNNSSGTVIQSGNITNLNLPTGSGYADGQTLYLSPTVAGGYTTTKPLAPNHYVAIGTITRAHPTLGTIQIAIRNGFQLDEMSDVSIPLVPADSVLLQFSRVDSLWHDVSPTTAIGNRYIKPSDTASMLTNYAKTSAVNLKVNISDTSTMLSKYLRKTDTASLSSRIDAKGYGINFGATQSTFAANTTYYLGMVGAGIATNSAQRRVYIPASGTVKQVYLYTRTANGTAGESWSMIFRLNNTSNTTIASTATTSTDKVFSNANLNVSVVAGDYFEIQTTTPATAPGISNIYGTLIIQ
jgi:hypothetical protein